MKKKVSIAILVAFSLLVLTHHLIGVARSTAPLNVTFIDVGQGDSCWLHLPNGDDVLVDGGKPQAGPTIVAYLDDQGVTDIELMVATHSVIAQDGTITPTVFVYLPIVCKQATPPPPVRILGGNWVEVTGSGPYLTLWVVGEVINGSSQPIEFVRIKGTSIDGFAASTYADTDGISPDMKSPFQILFQIENRAFVPCNENLWQDLHVESYNVASEGPYELLITSQNAYYTDSGSTYNVAGTITNQLGESHTFIKAFVTVYNSGSEAIGRGWTYTSPSGLDPGENATFHVRIYDWGDCPGGDHDIAGYQLKVIDD